MIVVANKEPSGRKHRRGSLDSIQDCTTIAAGAEGAGASGPSGRERSLRLLHGSENRAAGQAEPPFPLAEPWPAPGEKRFQKARDFFGATVFGLRPHFGFVREINGRQFALHDNLPDQKQARNSTQLFGRDHKLVGVDGSRGKWRRSCDEPDRNSGKDGGEKRRQYNRLWPVHRIDLLEMFEMLEAGPAIFEINQAKHECHGINSLVDYATTIAALCFRPVSSGDEIDFAGRENGFRVHLAALIRPRANNRPSQKFASKRRPLLLARGSR